MNSAAAGRAVYSTSLLESVDAASIEVTPMLAKAYQRVQNGSDIRGVAIAGAQKGTFLGMRTLYRLTCVC